jgi:hypothetical protein
VKITRQADTHYASLALLYNENPAFNKANLPALKGRHTLAQGAALRSGDTRNQALKGRNNISAPRYN